jgi:nicotinate-nucleotide adenylyltransferase
MNKLNDVDTSATHFDGESDSGQNLISAERIGIFGGTFNPLHMGHINALTTVHARMNLDKVMVVPAAQSPTKSPVEGASDEQRLEMLGRGLAEFSEFIKIDEQEIKRGGVSYTVDTVLAYSKSVAPENLFLIIGVDQFEEFDKWKDFEKILTLANLIVVTRPKFSLPYSVEDLPEGLGKLVEAFDRSFIALKTERTIEFVRLNDLDIAASDVRKRLRASLNVDRHLPIQVEQYIREQALYAPLGPRIGNYEEFAHFCAQALYEKKAINVKAFDLQGLEAPTDFTLVASGTSTRHAGSLAEAVVKAVKEEFGVLPQSMEGAKEGRWVLVDYGALMVHVFYDFVRQEYRLEDLWRAGREIDVKETKAP